MRWNHILGTACLIIITAACWPDKKEFGRTTAADTTLRDNKSGLNTEWEKRKKQLRGRIEDAHQQLDLNVRQMQNWWRDSQNIPEDAELEFKNLQEDLVRLQNDLGQSLSSLRQSSASEFSQREDKVKARVQQVEDELDQIREEMQEWYDQNLK